MTGPPLYLNDANYGPWLFLMKSKLSKLGAWQVVTGGKRLKEEDKPDEKIEYHRLDQVASIELVEHMDANHLAYVSQTLCETEASSGYSIWKLLKQKYAGDDYISKDLALEKFLNIECQDSIIDFIAQIRALNHRLVSAKVGLDDQVKCSMILRKLPASFKSFRDVVSVGCPGDTVAVLLNRLEKHAAQNHLDRVSMTVTQQAFLTTGEKIFLCPHCKRGFTICSHCDKAGHTEVNCFEKHPERRHAIKSGTPALSSKSKSDAQAHLAFTPVYNTPPHGFTSEQVEFEQNFQAMLANPEFKKLHPNHEYCL
ncbi:hypothetical protein MJO28_017106 [Puccinia striiformis f. sp. tritici]|uniref:DUF4219 domain-containing protein n=1 Tax=Puccinia striiformis TaxID=27350 RepID=A0A2S4VEV8_9BASI|nr:hypothetical protein MJO28_017106 [Puccinia striiformis f. sp. tritici]POW08076.1 hypothetical protein PSHT_09716 [Puccinia striiformis]